MALLNSKPEYQKYYGDFRGVDFSSDHTQVHDQRLAYSVNMFKDYQSGEGNAIETIVGFRRRVELPGEAIIYGIHHFEHKDENGNLLKKVLIHAENKLYLWQGYPKSVNIIMTEAVTLPEAVNDVSGVSVFKLILADNVAEVKNIEKPNGESLLINMSYDPETRVLTVSRSDLMAGDVLYVYYVEGVIEEEDALLSGMNTGKSSSFIFNNRLYIIDGKNYLVYDGSTVEAVANSAYIPTTYINIIPGGENSDIGTEYEQRNILQPKFKHTFIADGTITEFYMNENELDAINEVKVYGDVLTETEDYTVDLAKGKITLETAPLRPENVEGGYYPEGFAGVEITAEKVFTSVSGVTKETADINTLITDCTVVSIFDNRIFMSGNPAYPNNIFYCGINNTGYVDPTYFGILNNMQDGVGISPVTGMMPVADTLMVLKADSEQDGCVYFHSPTSTANNLQPKIYPSVQGLSGIGCLGAYINFLDDPVFISRLGVEAVGQLSVRLERAVEHRSSLIDSKLANIDLKKALLEEWGGYLLLLVDGKIFMADSRQKYVHTVGTTQYEWYYVESVGVFKNQYPEYRYSVQMYPELENVKVHYCRACKKSALKCECGDDADIIELPLSVADDVYDWELDETNNLLGQIANAPDNDGNTTAEIIDELVTLESEGIDYSAKVYYKIHEVRDKLDGDIIEYKALLCDAKGNKTGGTFYKASAIKAMDSNIFFGTENGVVCSFNFDMRDENGEILPKYYNFDERTIFSGCATKMDNVGIPHLTKNTVKKSLVIKTKSLQTSAAKIKVRTNKKPYEQIARINSTMFSFDNIDFSDFSFVSQEQSLFAVNEKEKKWVEKQYFLYSDEYQKPFALYYLTFRYNVAGRYKE